MAIFQDDQFPSRFEDFDFSDFLSQLYPNSDFDEVSVFPPAFFKEAYEKYCAVVFFDLNKEAISSELKIQLPEKSAYAFNAIVLKEEAEGVVVGLIDPFNAETLTSVQNILNVFVKPVMVKQKELKRLLSLTYRKIQQIQRCAESIVIQMPWVETIELSQHDADEQISSLAYLIIRDAVDIGASDVHIETTSHSLDIRLRIDGLLQKYSLTPPVLGEHLVRYFKLLSDVDITQNIKPSEGKKVAIFVEKKELNFRISFMPTYDGQSVAIRFLGSAESYRLEDKINDSVYLKAIKEYLARSYGMFLISGPTGSGKTTTQYSAIQTINTSERKIITLEDPVEAKIPGVTQIQVNEAIDYSFADGLRAVLRQDPDVIMLGEIRDELTANMAVRAAITGHLVLSTVHARGVIDIPIRLLNLKVDPYLLASALRLMVSQRLVRKICVHCQEIQAPNEIEMSFLERYKKTEWANEKFYRGRGCYYCQHSGFSGREAIFEMLHITASMITALAEHNMVDYRKLASQAMQDHSLLDNAFRLAVKGIIPLSEVLRMESD